MATKVGGFTKSGVVQCVNLVEESSIEMFNGTVSSNIITLNNGMKITFTYGPSDTPAGYTQTGSYLSFKDNTYGTPFLRLDINNTSTDKRVLASITNEEAWNSSEDLSIDMISGSIGAAVPSSPCKWVIEYKGQLQTYSISSQGHIITNAVGGHTLITSANRTPTVRMCKDGTLRCSKLIEEPIINLIDDYSGTAASPYDKYDKLVLNNGITLAVTKDGVPSENFFRTLVLQFSSAASTISRLFSINIMNSNVVSVTAGTAPDGSVPWEFKQDYPIDGYITVSTPGVYAAGQYVLTISDSTQSVNYSVTLDSSSAAFSFSPSTSGDYFILSYDMRMKVPTVRIGKDGTVRCAKVQEATPTSKIGIGEEWFDLTRTSASSGVFSLHNGSWAITVQGPNGGAPTLFQTVSTISAQTLSRDGTPISVIQWVGPPPYTTYYPSLYDAAPYNDDGDLGINRLNVTSTSSLSGYTILVNNGRSIITYQHSFFTGTNNVFIPSGDQPWVLTYSDRFTYSWD